MVGSYVDTFQNEGISGLCGQKNNILSGVILPCNRDTPLISTLFTGPKYVHIALEKFREIILKGFTVALKHHPIISIMYHT